MIPFVVTVAVMLAIYMSGMFVVVRRLGRSDPVDNREVQCRDSLLDPFRASPDDVALRLLAGAEVHGNVHLPSGTVLTPDEARVLSGFYGESYRGGVR